MNKKAVIDEDVFSVFGKDDKNRKPFLKRGETVTIIYENLPAVIVERVNGERWPVNISKLTIKST